MGLFSSTKKYFAYAGSTGLFDEDNFPDTLKSELIQSAISSHRSMADAIQMTLNTDQFARAKSMYKYAARYEDPSREGGYIRGLPTSNMNVVTVHPDAVESALTRAVGAYDEILSYKAGTYEEGFYLSKHVQSVWATHWDETQETITIPGTAITAPNTPDFIRIGAPNIPDNEDLREIMGHDAYIRRPASSSFDGKYNITWTYTDAGGAEAAYTIPDVDIGTYMSGNYIMAKYYVGTELFYWSYTVGSGADPILESAIEEEEKNAEFLPVAVLMQDKVWFDETADGLPDEETELAITTNRLMKKLATSGTQIKEDFIAQQEEDNASGDSSKSNAESWDFFVHYAIPIVTEVRGAKEYLFYFFKDLEDWSTYTSTDYYDYLASSTGSSYTKAQPINELNISEAGVNGYNVSYRWSFMETMAYPGEYTPIGATEPLAAKEIHKEIYERSDEITAAKQQEYQDAVDTFYGPGTPIGLFDPKPHTDNPANKDWERYGYHDIVIITRQNPEDINNPGVPQGYTRQLIMGLSMEYKINTKDTEHSTGKKGYNYRYAQPRLFGTDEETAEFRIPIQWGALMQMPTLHREEAVADGLTGTIFLVDVAKVKWYQTGFFKWLLIIIAIILIVISIWFPPLLEVAAWAVAAALGGSALIFVVVYVILIFAIGFMISLGTSLMSGKMQMYLAVVIFIAMLYTGQFQNIKTSLQAFKGAPGWGTAATLLNAVTPVYNMGFKVYSYNVMHDLEAEYNEMLLDQREQQQVLQDAKDNFGPMPSWLDPMDLVTMYERTGSSELADSYYSRVLNPNPGLLGYTLVSDFAEIGTMLPKEPGQVSIVEGAFLDFAEQRRQV